MRLPIKTTLAIALAASAATAGAGQFDTTVPMKDKGTTSFYVPGYIDGFGAIEMMVDTGSSYMTINEETLATLKANNKARYTRDLKGRLANGSELVVEVYRVDAVRIGDACQLKNVEAAVFPGKTRYILGLNALSQAAPFVFSMNPPSLVLSHCTKAADRDLGQVALALP
jgi:predicted aspartyl protease